MVIFFNGVIPQKTKVLLTNSSPCVVAMVGCAGFITRVKVVQSFDHEVKAMIHKIVEPDLGVKTHIHQRTTHSSILRIIFPLPLRKLCISCEFQFKNLIIKISKIKLKPYLSTT